MHHSFSLICVCRWKFSVWFFPNTAGLPLSSVSVSTLSTLLIWLSILKPTDSDDSCSCLFGVNKAGAGSWLLGLDI